MIAEQARYGQVENKLGCGRFKITVTVADKEFNGDVPVILSDNRGWSKFESEASSAGVPVVAYRCDERGMCAVIINHTKLEVRGITKITPDEIAYDTLTLNLKPTTERTLVDTSLTHKDKTPAQLLVTGVLRDGGHPFSARVYYSR